MPGIFVSNEYELSVANDYSYYSYNENKINIDKGGGVYANLLTRMYPEACKYKWETTNNYVNASKLSVLFSKARRYGFKYTAAKILKRVFKVDIRIPHGRDWMNPFDYWYENI